MGRTAVTPRQPSADVVHQLLHGYRHGHRLLAGSVALPPDALRLVDRLSDAAGSKTRPDHRGYLTGYPLPHDGYALAMTWHAKDAPRPNVVWTHTLVLPSTLLKAPTLQPLLGLFREPQQDDDLTAYARPLSPSDLGPGPLPYVPDAGCSDPAALVRALYGQPGRAWLPAGQDANDLCLAIWSQQWPRLRRTFSFCARTSEPRRLGNESLDLLLAPADGPHPPPASAGAAGIGQEAVAALVEDLACPGELRRFLHACGGDSSKLRSVAFLTDVWLMSRVDGDLLNVLADVARRAPLASSHRRLKRGLLRGPHPLLARASAASTLEALADSTIGGALLAEDADPDRWARLAWNSHSLRVAALAGASADGDEPSSGAAARQTAAEAVGRAALTAVRKQARPSDLRWLAASRPDLTADLLTTHTDPKWWQAWADLPLPLPSQVAQAAVTSSTNAEAACRSLLARPDGATRWEQLAELAPGVAASALLTACAATSRPLSDAWTLSLSRHNLELARAVSRDQSPSGLAAAADLAPRATAIARLPWTAWEALAAQEAKWRTQPVRAAVLLRAALATTGTEPDQAAAASYSVLYDALATTGSDDAWAVLEGMLPGQRNDWDRCKRLADGVAEAAAGHHSTPRPRLLDAVVGKEARHALKAALDQRAETQTKKAKARTPFDDFFDLFRR